MSIEFVAQEFWDYVNESAIPVAIKIIENNYLFVEVADIDFIVSTIGHTAVVSGGGAISTNYTTLNNYLTDPTITSLSNAQINTFMQSWSAPIDDDGHIIGASLFSGSTVGLQDAASYPGDYVGDFTVMLQPLDGGGGARGLTFSAGSVDWFGSNIVFVLVDQTEITFEAIESGEAEPVRVPNIVESDASILYDSVAYEVAVPTPNDWGFAIETDLNYPEYVFPAAFMYWDREITWMKDRMAAVKSYVEHTVGTQVVTFDVQINYINPPVYKNYLTGRVYIHTQGGANDLGIFNGQELPFTSYTVTLGSITIPQELSEEKYGFENEQFYAYKNVISAVKYNLNVRGRCVVTDPGTFQFVGTTGDYVAQSGSYASAAALLTSLDAAIPAGAPHNLDSGAPVNDWTRRIRTVGPGFADIGRFYAHVSTAISAVYTLNKTNISVDQCQVTPIARIVPTSHYIYNNETGDYTVDEDWPGVDPITNATCQITPTGRAGFMGIPINTPYTGTDFGGVAVPEIEIDGEVFTPEDTDSLPDFPPASFNLQNGIPAPVYPTYQGAFIYDLELKKWGKMKMSFLSLLDFAPVNTQSSQLLPNARYGVVGGILDADGKIFQWDANPLDAYIKYGKFSLFRLGVTTIQEIEAQFGIQSTGTLETETSLDGKTVDLSLSTSYTFTGERVVKAPISKTGVWHNIILRGQFDLTYLQVNAYRSGRR